jgi:hypothetical protein
MSDTLWGMPKGWSNERYKTIEITEEPTDETFITWLKANATKQVVVDNGVYYKFQLSDGKTWTFNDELNFDGLEVGVKYVADYESEHTNVMNIGFSVTETSGVLSLNFIEFKYGGDYPTRVYLSDVLWGMPPGWLSEAYKHITFITLPTDETFLTWLRANATEAKGNWQKYEMESTSVLVAKVIHADNKITLPNAINYLPKNSPNGSIAIIPVEPISTWLFKENPNISEVFYDSCICQIGPVCGQYLGLETEPNRIYLSNDSIPLDIYNAGYTNSFDFKNTYFSVFDASDLTLGKLESIAVQDETSAREDAMFVRKNDTWEFIAFATPRVVESYDGVVYIDASNIDE